MIGVKCIYPKSESLEYSPYLLEISVPVRIVIRNDSKYIYKLFISLSRFYNLIDECIPDNLIAEITVAMEARSLNCINLMTLVAELLSDALHIISDDTCRTSCQDEESFCSYDINRALNGGSELIGSSKYNLLLKHVRTRN